MISKNKQNQIIQTLKPYRPAKIGIFGSYVRDEEHAESDLDLLVDLRRKINLFELIDLEDELSKRLKIKVDLITEKSLNRHLRPHIEKEITYILNDEE